MTMHSLSKGKDVRRKKFYLKKGWLFLLFIAILAVCDSAPSAAVTPQVLKNVRLVYQNDNWHVVLKGSEFMTYKAVKMDNPLRLLIHMSNTLSQSVTYSRIFENEIIGHIKTTLFCRDSQPNSWVEVGLKKDISFEVKRLKEEIWVTLYTRGTEKVAAFDSIEEKPLLLPQRIGRADSSSLANKLLSIRTVKVDQKLLITILVNGTINDYDAFHLTNPPRLVVDLMGVQSSEIEDSLNLNGPLIDKVRVGLLEERVRTVFYLIPKLGLPYQVVLGKDRLQVSLTPGYGFPAR
jgi:hypothetical protein